MTLTDPQQSAEAILPTGPPSPVTRQHTIVDLVLVLFIAFSPPLASAVYLFFFPVKVDPSYANWRFTASLLHEIGALALSYVLLQRQRRNLKDIGLAFHWLDAPKGLALYFASLAVSYACSVAFQRGYYSWNHEYFQYRKTDAIYVGLSMVLMTGYTLAAPIFEEVLVRGYLMTELIRLSWPVWLAVLASVVLQTSYHLYYGLAGALIVGTTFAISAIYFAVSRRLWPVILSHLIWNLETIYQHWHH